MSQFSPTMSSSGSTFLRINKYQGDSYRYELAFAIRMLGMSTFSMGSKKGNSKKLLMDVSTNLKILTSSTLLAICTFDTDKNFLMLNSNVTQKICDDDVQRYIVNEVTNVVRSPVGQVLPCGTCNPNEARLIAKSWDGLFTCQGGPPTLLHPSLQ